jgi:hypothetical protein
MKLRLSPRILLTLILKSDGMGDPQCPRLALSPRISLHPERSSDSESPEAQAGDVPPSGTPGLLHDASRIDAAAAAMECNILRLIFPPQTQTPVVDRGSIAGIHMSRSHSTVGLAGRIQDVLVIVRSPDLLKCLP